jgi:excisionase family DNA binding protein
MRQSIDAVGSNPPTVISTDQHRGLRTQVWLDYAQAMEYLRVSRSTLDGWRRSGTISFTKLPNGQLRIRRTALDEWLESLIELQWSQS